MEPEPGIFQAAAAEKQDAMLESTGEAGCVRHVRPCLI